MTMRMLRVLLLAPFLLLLIAFVLSNPQPVQLSLWPTDVTLEAPLSIAALTIAAVFFLLGALLVWIPAIGTRYRARRAEKKVAALETKLAVYAKAPPGVKLLAGPR
jgi:uncharacterized integral membrane protein